MPSLRQQRRVRCNYNAMQCRESLTSKQSQALPIHIPFFPILICTFILLHSFLSTTSSPIHVAGGGGVQAVLASKLLGIHKLISNNFFSLSFLSLAQDRWLISLRFWFWAILLQPPQSHTQTPARDRRWLRHHLYLFGCCKNGFCLRLSGSTGKKLRARAWWIRGSWASRQRAWSSPGEQRGGALRGRGRVPDAAKDAGISNVSSDFVSNLFRVQQDS